MDVTYNKLFKMLIDKEWSKTEFRDAMASNYRKNSYFSNTARDFKYAKDIRLFKMQEFIQNMWNDINTYSV